LDRSCIRLLDSERFDVFDQLQEILLRDLALESGHDVLVEPRHDFRVWIENRFPNVGIIRYHGLAVVEQNLRSIDAAQDRAAALFIQQVARAAPQLLEQLLTLRRHGALGAAAAQPNITSMIRKGMTDQVISSFVEPSIGFGISSSERRRYLTAKMATAPKIRTVITTDTKMRK